MAMERERVDVSGLCRMAIDAVQSRAAEKDQKLDVIIGYLEQINKRDRARMIGSVVHSLIRVAFLLFVIWSTWLIIASLPAMVEQMTNQMIQGSIGIGPDSAGSGSLFDQYKEYFGL